MYQIHTLKNGLQVITIDLPHLQSVTTLLAVGVGSRYETRQTSGLSHFLEHMFFKGSKTYPSSELIANKIESAGAINNASTGKEYTYYWIKSAAKQLELSIEVLASMVKESLLEAEEIEKEKGVIVEELRMYHDHPGSYVGELYELLQYGDQPLGWDIGGEEKTVTKFQRQDFVRHLADYYLPANMALVFAGKLPKNILRLAERHFADLKPGQAKSFAPFQAQPQTQAKVNIHQRSIDQVHLILGVPSIDRHSPYRPVQRILSGILGQGMSSRLFVEVRGKRGLAYTVSSGYDLYQDTGSFNVYAGLKVAKLAEGLKVIRQEMEKLAETKVSPAELAKAKEMVAGSIARSTESTNFLAEYFGIQGVLDHNLESFEEYLAKLQAVSAEQVQQLAQQLFKKESYHLQLLGPIKDAAPLVKILS